MPSAFFLARKLFFAAVLALLFSHTAAASCLSGKLPNVLPILTFAESFEGMHRTDKGIVCYKVYVHPVRNGIYHVMLYRVGWKKNGNGGEASYVWGPAKLQWISDFHNAVSRRFALKERRGWKNLWLRKTARWEELFGDEYLAETQVFARIPVLVELDYPDQKP